jgi:hypothetical protein
MQAMALEGRLRLGLTVGARLSEPDMNQKGWPFIAKDRVAELRITGKWKEQTNSAMIQM